MPDEKIITWIQESIKKGSSKEQIADKLLRSGYNLEQVNNLFSSVSGSHIEVGSNRKNWVLTLAVGIIVLGIMGIIVLRIM